MTRIKPFGLPAGATVAAFETSGGQRQLGLRCGDALVHLPEALDHVHGPTWADGVPAAGLWRAQPERLELFLALESWPELLEGVSRAVDEVAGSGAVPISPLDGVRLRSPVGQPQKIVAVGLNYASHAAEADREVSPYPVLFAKFANTLAGADDDVAIPRATHRIDYEGELAIVVGRKAAWVDRADADAYVAGYCIANDVSARDYQFRTKEMLQGKTFDGFCPLGPWVSKPFPLPDLATAGLRTWVNGEQRQSAKLGEMVFDPATLIEYVSQVMTLMPGDVLLTGTPAGIGAGMRPRRWLRDGDVVTVEIDGIGRLTNRFVQGDGTAPAVDVTAP
jgi:acylpyruvate hydrolase